MQVDRLYKAGRVQGDLRIPNIIFGRDNEVRIIDWEWSGLVGQARFPQDVRIQSFGRRGSSAIKSGDLIDRKFEFLCLADVLEKLNCPVATVCASESDAQGTIQFLSEESLGREGHKAAKMREIVISCDRAPTTLNLGRLVF